MEKTNINRLLRVFIPFIVMVMSQNLILLLWDRLGFSGILGELIAFVIASASAAVLFLLGHMDHAESRPYKHKDAFAYAMHFFFCISMLIIFMHLTELITANYNSPPIRMTPVYLISVLIVHPVAEEYIFRRLFYGELRKINPVFGIIAQAIMFAIIHSTIDGMIYALAAGIFLGIASEKTGRLWVPILAHIFINARTLAYVSYFENMPTLRKNIDITVVLLGVIAIIVLLFLQAIRRDGKAEKDKAETEWTETNS